MRSLAFLDDSRPSTRRRRGGDTSKELGDGVRDVVAGALGRDGLGRDDFVVALRVDPDTHRFILCT